jgi:hypothetical protein
MDKFDLSSLDVAVGGLSVLVGLACLVGLLEAVSLRRAWHEVGRARRAAHERSLELDERERTQNAPEQAQTAPEGLLPHPDPPTGSSLWRATEGWRDSA